MVKHLSNHFIESYFPIVSKRKNENLKSDENILDYYIYNFKDTPILNQLFKYMYEYLEGNLNINEIEFY